ncbi:MAG TPA: hypothetical protein VNZ52_16765 [Candidatus Thermoplasmatota archaeon]|nr:hypothetical protein [Candidatus Thermoplasmatota archaeon]
MDSGPPILVAVLVTTLALGAAVYLERKARSLGALRSPPPWADVAPGPQGSLVLALAALGGPRAVPPGVDAPSPVAARGEVEARLRNVLVLRWSERLALPEQALLRQVEAGTLPAMPPEVRSFLAGEGAEERWRARARRDFQGPALLFNPWFRYVYLRRLTPADRALRDLELILDASEASRS